MLKDCAIGCSECSSVTLTRIPQFSHPREQQEWRETIEAVIRGNQFCRKALEALKKQDLAAAFDFADKARRVKVEFGYIKLST